MGFNRETQYPGRYYSGTALSNTAVDIGTGPQKVAWCILVGGAAEEFVLLRTQDAALTFFAVKLPAGKVVPLGGFKAEQSLEIITLGAAGDVGYLISSADL